MNKITIILLSLILFVGCKLGNKRDENNKEIKTVQEASLRFNWLTTCSYAGDIVGAEKFAKENNLNLRLDRGGIGVDPIKLVQSGENTFGLAGADLVLIANDKGTDFVIIGLANYNSPGVWVSKKNKNITSIDDIKPTTRIGELPGGNMIYLYEVFIKKAGLERNRDFKPVPIPFDLTGFIQRDECELRPVFIYEVLPELDMLGIEYNVIEPKDIGVAFKGLVYFCKRSTIEKNPVLVQSFVNTMIQGWDFSLNNNKEAIDYIQKFDSQINPEKELIGLKAGESYFSGYNGKLLYSDKNSWNEMIGDLRSLGFLKNSVELDKVLNLQFVENYYEKK